MIEPRSEVNKEIISFLKAAISTSLPVYNSDLLSDKPTSSTRIEYRLTNYRSTGQTRSKRVDTSIFQAESVTGYDCQLIIKVIGNPSVASIVSGEIAGAIQTFEYLEQYVNNIDIKNETLRSRTIPIKENGVIYNMHQLIVDCYIGLEYKSKIDYFDTLGDIEITIK